MSTQLPCSIAPSSAIAIQLHVHATLQDPSSLCRGLRALLLLQNIYIGMYLCPVTGSADSLRHAVKQSKLHCKCISIHADADQIDLAVRQTNTFSRC